MKKNGILNARLSYIIASMGHTDRLVICDSGLPIAKKTNVVDLALVENIPTFIDTLRSVLKELKVERAIIAGEMEKVNNKIFKQVIQVMDDTPLDKVPHEKFKELTHGTGNISFVRTGEATPFANIILISGVIFD